MDNVSCHQMQLITEECIIIKNCVNLINLMNMISSSWSIYTHDRNGDSDYRSVRTSNKIKVYKSASSTKCQRVILQNLQ